LGIHIEEAFLKFILNQLKQQDITTVQSQYIPTAKNMQVMDFYDGQSFQRISEQNGCVNYVIDVSLHNFEIKPYYRIN
jgi:predicted enzyme involved in methoxymalonyl-ACP biosynthesis